MKVRSTNRTLIAALILNGALGVISTGRANAESPDLQKDAVALWDFGEGTGASLRDVSGNGHHGKIIGATWVEGGWGSALNFDRAKRNYVSIPDSPDLHLQPPYSLGVWFRTTSSRNNAVYLLKNGGTFTGCGVYYYGDSMAMYVDAKGVDKKLYHKGGSSKSLPDGTWHHVVATCGNGKQKLFLDGQVFVERDVPTDLKLDYGGTRGVQLGHWLGNGHFDGMMGKAFILKRSLANDEVSALHDAERRRFNNDVTIRRTAVRPRIDGGLDDVCWKNQPALGHFTRTDYDSTRAEQPTTARLTFDDANLYLAVKCDSPDASAISSEGRPRDDERVADDERVEFFVSTRKGSYFHFTLTSAGVLLDRRCDYEVERHGYSPRSFSRFVSDRSWNCEGVKTAVQRGDRGWSLEMAIPLAELGRATRGARWSLNVARWNSQANELTTFSPLFQRLDQPEAFSTLKFAGDTAVVTRSAKKYVSIDITPRAKTNYDLGSSEQAIIFASNYLQRGSYTSLPAQGDERKTLQLFGALGEFEPATFSVRATGRQLRDVQVAVVGDLKNARGDVIPASNVEIRIVELWRRQLNSRQHMYMERFLERLTATDIPRHTTRRFWLTMHIPEQAQGGVYRSEIRVSAGAATLKMLDIEVEVLPLQLQQADGMGYFMYLPTWGIPPKLRTREYLKKIFVDMRKHGMTTATLYPYGLPFGSVMDVLRDSALMKPGVPAIWLGADAVGEEKWKSVLDEAREKKWPELALYLQDEPGDQARIDNAKRLFEILKQFRRRHPEHSGVRATTAIGATGIKALGAHYDIWIAGAGFDEQLVAKSKRMKKLLWSYDCNLAPVDAESCRHYFGLWCWKAGVKGSALWAYADPGSTRSDAWDDVFKNVDETELHYSFVLPTPDDLVPTIGWEAVREGVDDYRYLTTLAKLTRRAEEAGLKADEKRARRVLRELTDKIDVNGLRAGSLGGEATKRRLGNHYDRTSPQRDIPARGYDRIRRRVADEILRLQRVLRD